MAMSGFLPGRFEVREVQAIGVCETLSWLKNFSVFHIILEMDSLHVFNALCDTIVYLNGFGTIINDCRALAHSLGDVLSLLFVNLQTLTLVLLLGWGVLCQVQVSGVMFHLPG